MSIIVKHLENCQSHTEVKTLTIFRVHRKQMWFKRLKMSKHIASFKERLKECWGLRHQQVILDTPKRQTIE